MTEKYVNALPTGYRLDGTQAEQYEILSILGAGGFGITYKARDHVLQSDVAIKEYLPMDLALRQSDGVSIVPRASSQNEDYEWGLQQFMDEARTLSRFKSEPNIVRVESFIRANNTAYMVMQYEEGESLEKYLAQHGVLNEEQIKSIMMPILIGLRTVHAASFLHRDIKPGNIYLRQNDTPILLDFGAARQALSEHSRSVTGILTAGYAPFEQYSTRAKLLPATDLYAFGATLYKCMTGTTPTESTERLNAIHNGVADPLVPAEQVTGGRYSRVLYDCLHWLLQPFSKDRPQSVDEVIGFLNANQNTPATQYVQTDITRPVELAPPSPSFQFEQRKPKSEWLNRMTVPVLGLVAVACVSVVVTLLLTDKPDPNKKTAGTVSGGTPVAGVSSGATQPKGEQPSAGAAAGGGRADLKTKKTTITKTGLSSAEKAAIEKRYRQGVRYYLGAEGFPINFALAFKHFDYAANKGHAQAQGYLGLMYLNGTYVKKDLGIGCEWSRQAAEAGVARAQNNVANCYKTGQGKQKNYQLAIRWYKKAVAQELPIAFYNYGNMFLNGLGVVKNYATAISWYQKASAAGYVAADAQLAHMHYNGIGVPKNYQRAHQLYLKAAQRNYDHAQYWMGLLYINGHGVGKDLNKAVFWYRKAATPRGSKPGHPSALNNLGLFYRYGVVVKKDYGRAYELFAASAKQGTLVAFNNLGDMHWFGYGVPKDYGKALKLYRVAADKNNPYAQYQFGLAYQYGWGVSKSYDLAFDWYMKGARQKYAKGQFAIGVMYDFGYGRPKNFAEARKWYKLAADQGHSGAANNLAVLLKTGSGGPKSFPQALRLFHKSAAKKNNLAMRSLGIMYEKGEGVPRDYTKARQYYELALRHGNKRAQQDLIRLRNKRLGL